MKIILSVAISFIVAFVIFYIFMTSYPNTLAFREETFYSQNFENDKKKVFVIGSSHVGQLNTTLINDYVKQVHHDYEIFNLAYQGDTPQKRIKTLEQMISSKPDIVVIGVSFRDFDSKNIKNEFDMKKYSIGVILSDSIENNFFSNPKFTTLTAIRDLNSEQESDNYKINTPFFSYLSNQKIATIKELNDEAITSNPSKLFISDIQTNEQLKYLKKMINEFQKNNVKVVIFATPLNTIYLKDIPEIQKESFKQILDEVQKNNVMIYDLTEKYSDKPIWLNTSHVAYNKNSTIYSEDIAKIIVNEIES